MSAGLIIGGIAAVAGAGAAVYGANKNAKAIENANKTNAQIASDANEYNYNMWLQTKGVDRDTGQNVNTKLPRWMQVRTNSQPVPRRLVKRGASTPAALRATPYDNLSAAPLGHYTAQLSNTDAAGSSALSTGKGKTESKAR